MHSIRSRCAAGAGAGKPGSPNAPAPPPSGNIGRSSNKIRDLRLMFSRAAPRYDLMNRIMSMGRDFSWRRFAIEEAKFPHGSLILDLGTGTGEMARSVAHLVPGSHVIGVDNCPALVALARVKQGVENTRWILGDGGYLPFSSNRFDGAVAAFSLRNMPDVSQVLSELYRVIVPGGRAVILDLVRPEGGLCGIIFNLQMGHIVPALGRVFGSNPEAYSYLPESIRSFYSSAGLREALRSHGFKELLFRELMFKTVAVCIAEK